jgi:hypothetical protein
MRHMLIINQRSAKLACGPAIEAWFPMTSQALDPSGIGKINVTLRPENVTCGRCVAHMAYDAPTAPKSAEALANDCP